MKKQKNGFINFICSLIPGAGPMNMGLEKQGLSIMTLFWGVIAIGVLLHMEWMILALPVIWCYSFFHTHNLKNMSEEQFAQEEDTWLFRLDYLIDNHKELFQKYRMWIAGALIVAGICVLAQELIDLFWYIIPDFLYDTVYHTTGLLSAFVTGGVLIAIGIVMLQKKQHSDSN